MTHTILIVAMVLLSLVTGYLLGYGDRLGHRATKEQADRKDA